MEIFALFSRHVIGLVLPGVPGRHFWRLTCLWWACGPDDHCGWQVGNATSIRARSKSLLLKRRPSSVPETCVNYHTSFAILCIFFHTCSLSESPALPCSPSFTLTRVSAELSRGSFSGTGANCRQKILKSNKCKAFVNAETTNRCSCISLHVLRLHGDFVRFLLVLKPTYLPRLLLMVRFEHFAILFSSKFRVTAFHSGRGKR